MITALDTFRGKRVAWKWTIYKAKFNGSNSRVDRFRYDSNCKYFVLLIDVEDHLLSCLGFQFDIVHEQTECVKNFGLQPCFHYHDDHVNLLGKERCYTSDEHDMNSYFFRRAKTLHDATVIGL